MLNNKAPKIACGIILTLFLFVSVPKTLGQPALNEPWTPPSQFTPETHYFASSSKLSSQSIGTVKPGPGLIFIAKIIDAYGNEKGTFSESDLIYFVFYTNSPGWLFIVEYYPPGSIPDRHWLMYGLSVPSSGYWLIGPFIAEATEPEGLHTWRAFYSSLGTLADNIYRWTFERTPNVIPTSCNIAVSAQKVNIHTPVSVTVSVTPLPQGGLLTISVSTDGTTWTQIASGDASSGTITATYTPASAMTYQFLAKYLGYTYVAPGVKNQYSGSFGQTSVLVVLIETTLSVSTPASIFVGDAAAISGYISPAFSAAQIVIQIVGPETTTSYATTQNGQYSFSYTPEKAGTYSVQAVFKGDPDHSGSQSSVISFEAKKIPTSLTLTASPQSGSIDVVTQASTVITISGTVSGNKGGISVPVNLTYTSSSGQTYLDATTTDVNGYFSRTFAPKSPGKWTMKAAFLGDDKYEASSSQISVNVETSYTTLLIIVAFVLIVAAGLLLFMKRRVRKPPPPPAPTPVPKPPPAEPAKRFCMHCGTGMSVDAKSCPKCGKQPAGGPDTKVCPNCKSVINIIASFCPKCGAAQPKGG